MMVSSSFTTLFTTLAQVSFTLSGLLALAIAGDSKRRDYWFEHESRSFYVYGCFLLTLLPGFISVGGLIPSSSAKIPSWPFTLLLLGFVYSTLTILFSIRRKRLADLKEFIRLEKNFFTLIPQMGIYSFGMIALVIGGSAACYQSNARNYALAETLLGVMLFFSTIFGALNSIGLLQSNESRPKDSLEANPPTKSQEKTDISKGANSSSYTLMNLFIAGIAFLVGVFISRKKD